MMCNKTILGLAAGTALLAAAPRSNAWTQPVGGPTPIDTCTAQGPGNLFTLYTNEYDFQTTINNTLTTVYSYRFDLFNNTDTSGLALLALDTTPTGGADYFIGFGPDSTGTGLHDSNIGYTSSPSVVTVGQDNTQTVPATWSANANTTAGTTTVTFYANGTSNAIGKNSDLMGIDGTKQSEYFFVQSLTNVSSFNATVQDAKGNSYSLQTCPTMVPPHGQPVPEPASLVPFAFGGLGLLALSLRARRARAAG